MFFSVWLYLIFLKYNSLKLVTQIRIIISFAIYYVMTDGNRELNIHLTVSSKHECNLLSQSLFVCVCVGFFFCLENADSRLADVHLVSSNEYFPHFRQYCDLANANNCVKIFKALCLKVIQVLCAATLPYHFP